MIFYIQNSFDDFYKIVNENRKKFSSGVVHSFIGTEEQLKNILSLDLYVGVTSSTLQTEESCNMIKNCPTDRLVLETDSPYQFMA